MVVGYGGYMNSPVKRAQPGRGHFGRLWIILSLDGPQKQRIDDELPGRRPEFVVVHNPGSPRNSKRLHNQKFHGRVPGGLPDTQHHRRIQQCSDWHGCVVYNKPSPRQFEKKNVFISLIVFHDFHVDIHFNWVFFLLQILLHGNFFGTWFKKFLERPGWTAHPSILYSESDYRWCIPVGHILHAYFHMTPSGSRHLNWNCTHEHNNNTIPRYSQWKWRFREYEIISDEVVDYICYWWHRMILLYPRAGRGSSSNPPNSSPRSRLSTLGCGCRWSASWRWDQRCLEGRASEYLNGDEICNLRIWSLFVVGLRVRKGLPCIYV